MQQSGVFFSKIESKISSTHKIIMKFLYQKLCIYSRASSLFHSQDHVAYFPAFHIVLLLLLQREYIFFWSLPLFGTFLHRSCSPRLSFLSCLAAFWNFSTFRTGAGCLVPITVVLVFEFIFLATGIFNWTFNPLQFTVWIKKAEIALAEMARAVSASWKTHSCKLIPNWIETV